MDEARWPVDGMRRLTAAVLAAVTLAACGDGGRDSAPDPTTAADAGAPGAIRALGDAGDAVVRIVARGAHSEPGADLAAVERTRERTGSGFVVDPEGIVVTDQRVVAGAAALEVFVGGGGEPVRATVVGESQCDGLAVLDLDGAGYPSLRWRDGAPDDDMEVRAMSAAGGATGAAAPTTTRGRVTRSKADGDTPWASIPSTIAHDARVGPEGSGGPLVSPADASVVAVNISVADASTTSEHSLAIPAAFARRVVDDLRDGGARSLGVDGHALYDEDARAIGVWVSSVATGGPADEAGLLPGDVIERIEGLPLAVDGTMRDYCGVVRSHDATDVLAVQVLRVADGSRLAGELNGAPIEPYESLVADVEEDTGDDLAEHEPYEYVTTTDDTGVLVVDIPREWAEVATETIALDGGAELPQIVAAPDLDAYLETYEVPGMSFAVDREGSIGIDEFLASSDFGADCTTEGPEPYEDGLYRGRVEYWTDCGERGAVIVVIGAQPPGGEFTLRVVAQVLSESDVEALDTIVRTFRVDLGAEPGPAARAALLPSPR